MLESARLLAVAKIKPLVSDRTWQSLRRFDPKVVRRRSQQKITRFLGTGRAGARARRQGDEELSPEPLPGPMRLLLADLEAILAVKARPKVAVLSYGTSGAVEAHLRQRFPDSRTTTLRIDRDTPALPVQLAAHGPYDVIVDAAGNHPNAAEFYRSVVFHLRRGGYFATAELRPELPAPGGLWPLISRLIALKAAGGEPSAPNQDEESLAQSISQVVVHDGLLLTRHETSSLAKLRESDVGSILELTGNRIGTVLVQRPAEEFQPRGVVRDHAAETRVRERRPIQVPALSVRRYHDVVCSPAQVVVKGNLLLPETYRHHLEPRLVNRVTTEIAPRFAQVRRNLGSPRRLSGAYFHFDSEWPGHFGHVLSEQVSRLWGLEVARQHHPDLKVLLGRRPREQAAMPFERAILESVGVPESDIELYDKPVLVENLLAATPMFSMPHYVSPHIAPIWRAIGRASAAQEPAGPTPRKFFCGRERQTRRCRNAGPVEQAFAEAGFAIVFPEHMSFAAQIAMFRNAEVVAGYAGSALFTLLFCEPKRVIMIAPESYTANNEYLIGAVVGHEFDVFWSVPDNGSLTSSYEFDFDREGRHLRRLLDQLA